MDAAPDFRSTETSQLAWAIAKGGIGVATFIAFLALAWYSAATLFLIFSGVLLGVFLNAVANLLGRLMGGAYHLRLTIVCVVMAGLLSGVLFLGGSTIAQQATILSRTIRAQIVNVKDFLEKRGIDTSVLDLSNVSAAAADHQSHATTVPKLPDAGALASSTGAIFSQTFKLIIGTVGAVGNFFIVLFLGLAFAAQPSVYRDGILAIAPARHRAKTADVVDRISETLQRWLVAQLIVMLAVFLITWIGLVIIGIPAAFILGIQAGLLAFIPTVGALIGGLIIVLASLASGWVAAASAAALFFGVHALESYVLTPVLQRHAIDIPPATLFAMQILLGVLFGVWGLALALPLMAIVKVTVAELRTDEPPPLTA
ncbi:MAG: AI-2E family transporter [Pseudomonadota bacterium]|jgi:predicted PurR-regulated permease PerM